MARDVPDHRQFDRGRRAVHLWPIGDVISFPADAVARLKRAVAPMLGAVRRPRQAAAGIASLWHFVARGGITVLTPSAGRAMIATTVQPDGDIYTVVDAAILAWQVDSQTELRKQHSELVRQSLAQITSVAELLRSLSFLATPVFIILNAIAVAAVLTRQEYWTILA